MRRSIIYLFLPLVTCTPSLFFGMEKKRIAPYILADPRSIPTDLHDKIYFDQLEFNMHNPFVTIPNIVSLWSVNKGIRALVEHKTAELKLLQDPFTPRALYNFYTATGTGFSCADICELLPAESFARTIQQCALTVVNRIDALAKSMTCGRLHMDCTGTHCDKEKVLVKFLEDYYQEKLDENKKFAQFVSRYTWQQSVKEDKELFKHYKTHGLFSLLGLAIMYKQYHVAHKLIEWGAPLDRCRIRSSYGKKRKHKYHGANEFLLTLLECKALESRNFSVYLDGRRNFTITQNDFLAEEDAEMHGFEQNNTPTVRSKGLHALIHAFMQNGIDLSWKSERGICLRKYITRRPLYNKYIDTADAQNYLANPNNSTKTTEHARAIKTIFVYNNYDLAQTIITTTPTPQRFWLRLCNNTDFGFKIFGTKNWPDRLANLIDQNLIDPNLPDINGNTLLHLAAFNQEKANKKLVKILFAPERLRKPNIDAVDTKGRTALSLAIKSQNARLLRFLLQRGANPSINKKNQDTFLFKKIITQKKIIDPSCRVDLVRNYLSGVQESEYSKKNSSYLSRLLSEDCFNSGESRPIHMALPQQNYHLLDILLIFGAIPTLYDLQYVEEVELPRIYKNRLKEALCEQQYTGEV